MYKGIFVTGTDTGVGKTYIAASIASVLKKHGLSVGVMKPVATGDREDARNLIDAAGIDETIETVNPVFLKYPMAPMMSARLSGKRVNMHPVWKSFRHMQATYDFTIVEGVGGIMVPVKKDYAVLDMIHEFKLPVLVVARPNLGTINHTLLTIDKLRREKITIAGVILSCRQSSTLAEKTNPELIRELTGLPVHEVPCEKNITLRQIETLIRPEILGLRSEK